MLTVGCAKDGIDEIVEDGSSEEIGIGLEEILGRVD
jgi:hypothetical protein